MPAQSLPEGHHTLTPAAIVPGAARLIDFLVQTFGAVEVERYESPDGRIVHAEVRIADSSLMLGDASAQVPAMPCTCAVYVDDVDATYARALAAGARSLEEPKNQLYGYRSARVQDPTGNVWSISRVVEQVSREELQRRMAAKGQGG